MTPSQLMQAMSDAGAPFEAILIAVRALEEKDAEIARREAEVAEKRAKDAERTARRRAMLPADWDTLRIQIFKRDDWTCTYCGSQFDLQCDHIVPLCQGGSNDDTNLTTACASCNASKGGRTVEQWRGA